MPSDVKLFYGGGVRISSAKVPRAALPTYRRGLDYIARAIILDQENVALWKLWLLYDGMILGPCVKPESFASAVKRRVSLFLAGSWATLLEHELKFRESAYITNPQSASDDPRDIAASRASLHLEKNHSLRGASAALRAPTNTRSPLPGVLSSTFRKLNPRVGAVAPTVPCNPGGGGDVEPIYSPMISLRRPLNPPEIASPAPIQFTTLQIVQRVRRGDCASAGGPNGTNYKTLRSWFAEADVISDHLCTVINFVAAGLVPPEVAKLLNAGRGVAIPKDATNYRPIVVSSVILRLIGSLMMQLMQVDIGSYFLNPAPLQFGVGVPSGCELVAAAIGSHLEAHPGHIDISSDQANAFQQWRRSKMWPTLRQHFPSMYSFVKLLYGDISSILFQEPGGDIFEILNSVGSRQGCALGSFLFALALHPLHPILLTLANEFPDVLILAFCDDCHFVGEPHRAVEAYRRYAFLVGIELQGQLRNEKGVVYSPTVRAADLYELPPAAADVLVFSPNIPAVSLYMRGLPVDMPVTNEGIRILGAPVGSATFCCKFADKLVDDICNDLETVGRMSSFQSQHTLVTKAVQHKINHLWRNSPCGEVESYGSIAAKYDEALSLVASRITGCTVLPTVPSRIVGLPLRHGGLGFRKWRCTADAALLAAYSLISSQFPKLFPGLAQFFPGVLTLNPSIPAPSQYAANAHRALLRLEAVVPLVRERLVNPTAASIRNAQSALTEAVDDAESVIVLAAIKRDDNPVHPRNLAQHLSQRGDSVTLGLVATDEHTTISNQLFRVIYKRRLLLPLTPFKESESIHCVSCGASSSEFLKCYLPAQVPVVDPMGDEAIRCMT